MTSINNEQFLTILLEKTLNKLNQSTSQNLILETQLKIANDKILVLEKELGKNSNDSTFKPAESY